MVKSNCKVPLGIKRATLTRKSSTLNAQNLLSVILMMIVILIVVKAMIMEITKSHASAMIFGMELENFNKSAEKSRQCPRIPEMGVFTLCSAI